MAIRTILCAALAIVLVTTTFTFAATQRDRDDCDQGQDHDRGIRGCTQVINDRTESQHKRMGAYYNRGLAWHAKGDYDRAIADYSEAIRIDPKQAQPYRNRADAWQAKGDFDHAIADLTEAIRLDRRNAGAYNQRGMTWRAKGDLDRAIADFDEVVRLNPKHSFAYNNRGVAWRDKGNPDRAIADFSEAIRLGPKNAKAYGNRGIVHLYSGAPAKALADFNQASELNPKDPYDALWVDIARHRNKVPSRLAEAIKAIDMTQWPGPIIRLYLGQSTLAAVLAAAEDSNKKTAQVCDANFFGGAWALRQDDKGEAARLFRLAASGCPHFFFHSYAARAELKALGEMP